MLNVSRKEKKCVRYLANEMSKAERAVFEIELTIDDELRAIFENYKMIWVSYPESKLPIQGNFYIQPRSHFRKLDNAAKATPFLSRKPAIFSVVLILFIGFGFYFTKTTSHSYANHKIARGGERLTVLLPDSSTVILNSGSEVKYSSDFGTKRDIWLKGEAFFTVIKNIDSPFIVHTNDFNVKVLGTEFNVNSNTINQTVSLATGKVNILLKESKDEINLIPNEELVWNAKTKAVIKRNFDVSKILAWKDNILLLDDIKLKDALPKIKQFYGVNCVINDNDLANQHINGAFEEQKFAEFITSLEFISNLNIVKTNENTFEIKKYNEN